MTKKVTLCGRLFIAFTPLLLMTQALERIKSTPPAHVTKNVTKPNLLAMDCVVPLRFLTLFIFLAGLVLRESAPKPHFFGEPYEMDQALLY